MKQVCNINLCGAGFKAISEGFGTEWNHNEKPRTKDAEITPRAHPPLTREELR